MRFYENSKIILEFFNKTNILTQLLNKFEKKIVQKKCNSS